MVATKRLLAAARMDERLKRNKSVAAVVRDLSETKYVNRTIAHTTTANSTTTLSGISSGSGTSQRDGRKILMSALEIRWHCNSDTPVRCVIYVPKGAPGTVLSLSAWSDPVENDEFWVLYDVIIDANGGTTSFNRKLRQKLTIEYSDSTISATRNPVYMLLQTSGNTTIVGHTKLWYKDM